MRVLNDGTRWAGTPGVHGGASSGSVWPSLCGAKINKIPQNVQVAWGASAHGRHGFLEGSEANKNIFLVSGLQKGDTALGRHASESAGPSAPGVASEVHVEGI